jgi:hypothetical protein
MVREELGGDFYRDYIGFAELDDFLLGLRILANTSKTLLIISSLKYCVLMSAMENGPLRSFSIERWCAALATDTAVSDILKWYSSAFLFRL